MTKQNTANSVNSIFSDESTYYLERKANRRVLNYTVVTLMSTTIIYILNLLDIFIIDKTLMGIAYFSSLPCIVIPPVLCKIYGIEKKWIKYMILFFTVIFGGIWYCCLTYHAIIVSVLPILYASMYGNKKVLFTVFGLNLGVNLIAIYLGYFFGLCDANTLLLTTGPMSDYVINNVPYFSSVNENPWVTLILYYGFPRAISMFIVMRVCISISRSMQHLSEHTVIMRHESETDKMTGLYNRNKYLSAINSDEFHNMNIAVLFFDINRLKYVNDTYGHEYGDILIKKVSDSILSSLDSECKAFRIGGDEIVVIIGNGTLSKATQIAEECINKLRIEQQITTLPLSSAVGVAAGKGEDIEYIINTADKMMYEDKCRYKEELRKTEEHK